MDPVTHALLGGTMAVLFTPRPRLITASVVGGCAALLADLDVLIHSSQDPLLQLEFHRQFTHALLFTPVGGLVAALLLWWWARGRATFRQTWMMGCWGYVTAGPLDACTSYGTQLLWPFSDLRIAWSIVPVVEPVTTILLAIFLRLALLRRRRRWAVVGGITLGLWLGVAWLQHQRAIDMALFWAQQRGDPVEVLHVKPTLMNLVLWRAVYKSGPDIQSVALRPGLWEEARLYPGERARWIDPTKPLPGIPMESVLGQDVRRFVRLSDHFVVIHPRHPQVLGDGRYAMLPHTIDPLWGITLDPNRLERHAPFDTFRAWWPENAGVLLHMLLGREGVPAARTGIKIRQSHHLFPLHTGLRPGKGHQVFRATAEAVVTGVKRHEQLTP
ncbi:MAG: metal-dependent hydrolase [Magnetococcales bacterium]|nr:metal-dependent hydrolase [Magnetococcales bacterium]